MFLHGHMIKLDIATSASVAEVWLAHRLPPLLTATRPCGTVGMVGTQESVPNFVHLVRGRVLGPAFDHA
jgi:hypothetical protein